MPNVCKNFSKLGNVLDDISISTVLKGRFMTEVGDLMGWCERRDEKGAWQQGPHHFLGFILISNSNTNPNIISARANTCGKRGAWRSK